MVSAIQLGQEGSFGTRMSSNDETGGEVRKRVDGTALLSSQCSVRCMIVVDQQLECRLPTSRDRRGFGVVANVSEREVGWGEG